MECEGCDKIGPVTRYDAYLNIDGEQGIATCSLCLDCLKHLKRYEKNARRLADQRASIEIRRNIKIGEKLEDDEILSGTDTYAQS